MSDAPPPGGHPEPPQQPGGYQPPGPPQPPPYQPPQQFQPIPPPSNTSGNGCLKAFLIVLAISTVLGVIAFVGFILAARSVVEEMNNDRDVAEAKDYEATIDEGSCKIDSLGSMTASGVFTNKADRRQAYRVAVDYYDNTNTKLKSDIYHVRTGALDKDAKTKWTSKAINPGTAPESITCKVGQVNYAIS